MKKIGIIGIYVWVFVASAILILSPTALFCGCSCKTYESVIRDTMTVERVDSVLITMREVDVSVPVPKIHLEQWVSIDSISVLDNGLYKSTVEVRDGQIHHTLEPVHGAELTGTAIVADTSRTSSHKSVTVRREKEKTVTVRQEKKLWWQRIWSFLVFVCFFLAAAVSLLCCIRRALSRNHE